MFMDIKALIVVLALAVPAFYLGRQLTTQFVAPQEFAVWRNTWFAITIAAFLCGNYFVFAVVAAAITLYARARAAGPNLFYLCLFAVPTVNVEMGGLGLYLFSLNNARELAMLLLLPSLLVGRPPSYRSSRICTTPDWLILSYTFLLVALQLRQSEITNVGRSALVLTLDILLPYFVFSRAVTTLSDFRKVLLAYIIAVLALSMVGAVEFAKGWHLYAGIASQWGQEIGYVRRDGLLRAAGSAGGGITLGYVLMVAIGCVLAIWQNVPRRYAAVSLIFISVGLVAALSRGPWIGTAVLIICFFATGRNAVRDLGMLILVSVVVLGVCLLLPGGEKVLNMLPFLGSVDDGSVTYRQQLIDNAFTVIARNLWFGLPDFLSAPELQAMVQGEGIVDTVNSYLVIALVSGISGLILFTGFFVVILVELRQVLKSKLIHNSDIKTYARAAMATLFAILVVIGTTSSIDFVPYVYWSFAGLCVALVRIAFRQRAELSSSHNQQTAPPIPVRAAISGLGTRRT
jgi:O-Antigen ligase